MMKKTCKWNPCMTAGMLMELLYLCTDHLAILQSLLGGHLGSFVQGLWQGVTIGLLLLGLLLMTPKGQNFLKKLKQCKKHEGGNGAC